jgi:hypothetical protein
MKNLFFVFCFDALTTDSNHRTLGTDLSIGKGLTISIYVSAKIQFNSSGHASSEV